MARFTQIEVWADPTGIGGKYEVMRAIGDLARYKNPRARQLNLSPGWQFVVRKVGGGELFKNANGGLEFSPTEVCVSSGGHEMFRGNFDEAITWIVNNSGA